MNEKSADSAGKLRRARICALASGVLLVLVMVTGGLRSAAETPVRSESTMTSARESISVFAADRDALRRDELEQLREIAEDKETTDEIRTTAQERRMQLMRWMELEATIAQVLTARGYETPVVTVHEDSVNIVVRSEGLSKEEAEVILELTARETGVDGGNVKIIPIN